MRELEEWLTPAAAVTEYGLPIETIALHLQCGALKTATLCGALMVNRAEVAALALAMRAGLCVEDCE